MQERRAVISVQRRSRRRWEWQQETEHEAVPVRNFATGSKLVGFAKVMSSEDMHVMGHHWHVAWPRPSQTARWIHGYVVTLLNKITRLVVWKLTVVLSLVHPSSEISCERQWIFLLDGCVWKWSHEVKLTSKPLGPPDVWCLRYLWIHPCCIRTKYPQKSHRRRTAATLTFDAKLGVSSELEDHQHQEETGEGDRCDAHHNVHLASEERHFELQAKAPRMGSAPDHVNLIVKWEW